MGVFAGGNDALNQHAGLFADAPGAPQQAQLVGDVGMTLVALMLVQNHHITGFQLQQLVQEVDELPDREQQALPPGRQHRSRRAGVRGRVPHGVDSRFQRLLFGHLKLVDKVVFADAKSSVDSRVLGGLECLARNVDIFLSRSCQAANLNSFQLSREGVDSLKVTWRTNRKASFNDVDPKFDESVADLKLLWHREANAGALFAVAESGVENVYAVTHGFVYYTVPLGFSV